MKCKACGAPVNTSRWMYFADESEQPRPKKKQTEELCSLCLGEAKTAYYEMFDKDPQVIEFECKSMWKEGLKQEGDPVYMLTNQDEDVTLLIDLENFSLGTEEK